MGHGQVEAAGPVAVIRPHRKNVETRADCGLPGTGIRGIQWPLDASPPPALRALVARPTRRDPARRRRAVHHVRRHHRLDRDPRAAAVPARQRAAGVRELLQQDSPRPMVQHVIAACIGRRAAAFARRAARRGRDGSAGGRCRRCGSRPPPFRREALPCGAALGGLEAVVGGDQGEEGEHGSINGGDLVARQDTRLARTKALRTAATAPVQRVSERPRITSGLRQTPRSSVRQISTIRAR